MSFLKNVVVFLLMCISQGICAQKDSFVQFPENCDPKRVGEVLSQRFVSAKHMFYGNKWIHYAEVCNWYGALKFAEITNNTELLRQLQKRLDLLLTTEKEYLPVMNHVDLNVFGCIPLEMYKIVKDKRYLEAVLISFDKFVKHDLDECKLYHSFRSFSKEFVIDGQPSEVFQP